MFSLGWNEIGISALEITRKKRQQQYVVQSGRPCNLKTGHFKSLIGKKNDCEMFLIEEMHDVQIV